MLRGTFKGKRTGRKLPLFENSDFDLPFLFLVLILIPKVCAKKGKHRHFLQNVFFANFQTQNAFSEIATH